ncbi:MAG: sodium:solute symporter [Alistipes sp.]|nr:sodium:solute symporter [Alistipes sp.]
MTPFFTLATIALYLTLLFVVAQVSRRKTAAANFFTGGRSQPTWAVALAMIGAPLSGITFISVPGAVEADGFSYLQMVFGFIAGSFVIAYLLIPIYYKHNVTSLYEYLDNRFGVRSHKCGAWLFLVSKLLGSSLRTFVVCLVVQQLLCEPLGVPFWITASVFMTLVWLYTYRGGVGSVVWIDAVKTLCMILCAVLSIIYVLHELDIPLGAAIARASDEGLTQLFFVEDWNDSRHFVKMFFAGVFMIVAMTGLDQDMMQRALSSRTQRSAQRNVIFSSVLQTVIITLLLLLGSLLYLYIADAGVEGAKGDEAFAAVAMHKGMPMIISILLVLGVTSATFSTTASAMTALTTSFSVDILRNKDIAEHTRKWIHAAMAVISTLLVLAFEYWRNDSAINLVYSLASYTYGPLLGMFAFGIFSKREVRDSLVPVVAIVAMAICVVLVHFSDVLFGGYKFGSEVLLVNAALTIVGLFIISRKSVTTEE